MTSSLAGGEPWSTWLNHTGMPPTDILRAEHRLIEQVLQCLSQAIGEAENGAALNGDSIRKAIRFFCEFADRSHHAKEEWKLFPRLQQGEITGIPEVVQRMLSEHAEARSHVTAMAEHLPLADTGNAIARQRLCEHARAYVKLLTEHIKKEEETLFRIADEALTPVEQQSLADAFALIDREDAHVGTQEWVRWTVEELCAEWGVRPRTEAKRIGAGCCSR